MAVSGFQQWRPAVPPALLSNGSHKQTDYSSVFLFLSDCDCAQPKGLLHCRTLYTILVFLHAFLFHSRRWI